MIIVSKDKQFYQFIVVNNDDRSIIESDITIDVNEGKIKNNITGRALKKLPKVIYQPSDALNTTTPRTNGFYKYSTSVFHSDESPNTIMNNLRIFDKVASIWINSEGILSLCSATDYDELQGIYSLYEEDLTKQKEIFSLYLKHLSQLSKDKRGDSFCAISREARNLAHNTFVEKQKQKLGEITNNLENAIAAEIAESFDCSSAKARLIYKLSSRLTKENPLMVAKSVLCHYWANTAVASEIITIVREYISNCEILGVKCDSKAKTREITEICNSKNLYLKSIENSEAFVKLQSIYSKKTAFSTDKFQIMFPNAPEDLIKEGAQMHHCVGNYVDRVANFETLIVFVRKKTDLEQSYITCQIDINTGMIRQYYLAYDKCISNDEDVSFKKEYQNYLYEMWNN